MSRQAKSAIEEVGPAPRREGRTRAWARVTAPWLLAFGACAPKPVPARAPAPNAAPASTRAAPLVTRAAPETEPQTIPLWPEGVPDRLNDAPAEYLQDGRVYAVSEPTLTVYRPPPSGHAHGAVIICPGGGYVRLSLGNESGSAASFATQLGMTGFVLKYRLAPYRYPAALRDVLRAIRYVRAHAPELGVDPHRIGVFGASAGGHLAASAAALFDAPEGKTGAALDEVSARPDFVALLYPVVTMLGPQTHQGSRNALLGDSPTPELLRRASIETQIPADNPPTFIVHTSEDTSVPIENSLLLYGALRARNVPVEFHAYERGPHGFGMKSDLGTTSDWPARLRDWLRARGVLEP